MTREEATEKLKMILEEATEYENAVCYVTSCDANALDMAIKALEQTELERKPGKWIWDKRTGEYECSECGRNPVYERTTPDDNEIDKYRYCRWCGSPMEVQNETCD